MANERVMETPLASLRPVAAGGFSCLTESGELLPGFSWLEDRRGRHEGYSSVTNGDGVWAINDDGMMMTGTSKATRDEIDAIYRRANAGRGS